MKKVFAAGAVLFVFAILAIGFSPLLVSPQKVRTAVVQHVQTLTGRTLTFAGVPSVRFNPFLGVEIADAMLEADSGRPGEPPLAQIGLLRLRISLLAALTGRIEVHGVELVRPKLNLRFNADGARSWDFSQGGLRRLVDQIVERRTAANAGEKADPAVLPALGIGEFSVVDGSIAYENLKTARTETMTGINAVIAWPSAELPATVSGAATWRAEEIDFAVRAGEPLLLFAGGVSTATAQLKSKAFEFAFKGMANAISDLHLSGRATITTESLRRLMNFFGAGLQEGLALGKFTASGQLEGTLAKFDLRDASIVFAGQPARGGIQIVAEPAEKPQINATLAFNTVDLGPYLAFLNEQGGGPGLPGLDLLGRFVSDLRLSCAKAVIGAFSVSDVAASLTVRNSELVFDVGNAGFHEGNFAAKFSLTSKNGKAELTGVANLSGVSIAGAMGHLPQGGFRITGKADAETSIKASGASIVELISALNGKSAIKAGPGVLNGIDFNRVLAPGADRAGNAIPVALGGNTAFGALTAQLNFDSSHLWIERLELHGDKMEARMTGRADFASGGLALQVSAKGGASKARWISLFIGGLVSAPLMTRYPPLGEN